MRKYILVLLSTSLACMATGCNERTSGKRSLAKDLIHELAKTATYRVVGVVGSQEFEDCLMDSKWELGGNGLTITEMQGSPPYVISPGGMQYYISKTGDVVLEDENLNPKKTANRLSVLKNGRWVPASPRHFVICQKLVISYVLKKGNGGLVAVYNRKDHQLEITFDPVPGS